MAHKRKKRIWYTSGLLSLVLFPLLCLHFMGQNGLYTDLRVMEIHWLSPKLYGLYPKNIRLLRQYTEFDLTNNRHTAIPKTALIKRRIQSLVETRDTTNGIHVRFGDNTRYETFIQVLDACHKYKANFAPEGYDLWIFFQPRPKPRPEKHVEPIICGNGLMIDHMEAERAKQARYDETYREAMDKAPGTYFLSAGLLFLMFGATVWHSIQTFK